MLGVKILSDFRKGLWSYGGFKLRGSGWPKFSAPPSGETMRQTTKRFRGERTCSYGSARISPAAGVAKNVEFLLSVCLSLCLFLCLSVTLLNVRVCAPDFAMKALEYRNDFDAVG